MVSRITVVAFNRYGMLFPDYMAMAGQHLGESIPVVAVKHAFLQVLDFGV
jgi:hypothetical protein